MNIKELAELLGGQFCGSDSSVEIKGVNTLQNATESEASFLANMKYKDDLRNSNAGVILVSAGFSNDQDDGRTLIKLADPYLAFAQLQRHFNPSPRASGKRHVTAVIDPTASLADDVDVGPCVVIEEDVTVGSGTIVHAGSVIGRGVSIGQSCIIHARSVVSHGSVLGDRVILQSGAVIGSDGFGYAWDGKEHLKIPQTGRVVLEDDVEVGANSSIDRGALGDTVVRRGVKLDNLIQLGHNVEIGPYSIMASQVGISGSTKIGAGCQIGGQAGIAGHLVIGDGVKLAAKSGVLGNLDAGGTYAGFPVMPHRTWLKVSALIVRLPEIWKQIRKK
ncbi:MAG: UDP-3-O-(3-hydroxymyristoyl)glucosamine N-acyltransferase [Mariprofundaceae bacterium]|nr:UDP-3-O-(3-hydroxymyristoyl)glucosamine N-acyltransferase [Mariprofundaceae bacterium]